MTIADLRKEYAHATLSEADVHADPVAQFRRWLDDAIRAEVPEPTGMTLATATSDGAPSARTVLLKGLDERGFAFYTDYRSRKARELEGNPRAGLVFWWAALERQVRVTGRAARLPADESDAYYRSRPLGSRVGALASHQSSVLASRAALEARWAELSHEAESAGGDPARPAHWGGYVVAPDEVEFWQGRPSRLHDRIRYRRDADRWVVERLSP